MLLPPRFHKPADSHAVASLVFDLTECDVVPTAELNDLVRKAQAGCAASAEAACRSVYRMVFGYARSTCRKWRILNRLEDVLQDGMVGVSRAMNEWDEARGAFTTLAFLSAKREIWQCFAAYLFAQKVPKDALRRDSVREQVLPLVGKSESLDEPRSGARGAAGDDYFTAYDFLASARPELDREKAERQAIVAEALGQMKDIRDRTIVERRFFHENTLEEIGNDFNLTRERVRQLEARALAFLRDRTDIAEAVEAS